MQQDRSSVRVHGPALRYVRVQRQKSIAELARNAGVSRPFISLVEAGKKPSMRREVFDAVVSALAVDERVLMANPEAVTAHAA